MEPTQTAAGYRATKTDKALIIHEVEIFSACKRGDFSADERWVKHAVEKAMSEAREGYYPPLHIRHHDGDNDSVRSAGHFQITGVRPITLAGKRRNAVFADLYIKDQWAQQQIMDELLSYRSVEIFDTTEPPSIDGLALLDHEAPYLRLPMLMVSDIDDQTQGAGTFRALQNSGDGPFVYFHAGHSFNPLSREETDMATKQLPPKTEFGEGVANTNRAKFEDHDKPKKDDDDKSEHAEGDDGGGGLDVSSVVKAIESGEISIADMDAILAAIQSQGQTAEPEAETPAPAAAPGAEAMKKAMTPDMAAMQGRIDGLEAKDKSRDDSDQAKADVDSAFERLKDKPLGSDLREKLVAFRKDHGGKAFADYVESFAKAVGALPSDDGKGAAFVGQNGKLPEVALAYMDDGGSGAVDDAARFCADYDELIAHGQDITQTKERWVELSMKRAEKAAQEN